MADTIGLLSHQVSEDNYNGDDSDGHVTKARPDHFR